MNGSSIGNKAKRRISKWMLQENKGRKARKKAIFRKANIDILVDTKH